MFPRPLEGRYPAMVAIALAALVPYLVTTTADMFYRDEVGQALHAGPAALGIIAGVATAGYAFGALLGGDLINRFPQRVLFLICEALFIAGNLLAATAGGVILYGVGRVLGGLTTGLLLIISVPPVIRGFPPKHLPTSVAFINIGFFGAVTVGPLLGGAVAAGHLWRVFYAALAGVGACAWLLATVTLPDKEPPNRGLPLDLAGLGLGVAATALPFWAAGDVAHDGFRSVWFLAPMAVGLAAFAALLITEQNKKEALSPVHMMWTTYPVIGTLVAMIGGGALVTFLTLAAQLLMKVRHLSAFSTGLMFWPQALAVLVTATLLGLLVKTRFLPLLILAGMLVLIGAGILIATCDPQGSLLRLRAAAALLGLGAGATVSPGLYLAGFSLPSSMVGRIFALVELVRSVADFVLAPVMLEIAKIESGGKALTTVGIDTAVWVMVAIAFVATLLGTLLFLAGGAELQQPDLAKWLERKETAFESPPLAAAFRSPHKS